MNIASTVNMFPDISRSPNDTCPGREGTSSQVLHDWADVKNEMPSEKKIKRNSVRCCIVEGEETKIFIKIQMEADI